MHEVFLLSLIFTYRDWSPERLSNSAKVTQLRILKSEFELRIPVLTSALSGLTAQASCYVFLNFIHFLFFTSDGQGANIITRSEGDTSHAWAWKPNHHPYGLQKDLGFISNLYLTLALFYPVQRECQSLVDTKVAELSLADAQVSLEMLNASLQVCTVSIMERKVRRWSPWIQQRLKLEAPALFSSMARASLRCLLIILNWLMLSILSDGWGPWAYRSSYLILHRQDIHLSLNVNRGKKSTEG